MTKPQSVSEAAALYGTAVADLQHPSILQQEGQPLAVIVAFDEYQHLRALAVDETQRQQAGWQSWKRSSRTCINVRATSRPNRSKPKLGLRELK